MLILKEIPKEAENPYNHAFSEGRAQLQKPIFDGGRQAERQRWLSLVKDLQMPKIICLCGSTRFTNEMLVIQWNFTKQGFVVLSWCALPDSYFTGIDKAHIGDQEGVKKIVDEVHFRKIDLCDEVFIVNIGGYIGESTTNEIKYAVTHHKLVKFLEAEWHYPFMNDSQPI